ncbi:MAG: lasso peptide biosynthesis B2 protein [Gammaproteobacteria bacterium]|nr:lasso peptide biosynthesis B2 protein [Gammaproteobacteria bacterium]
MKFLRQLAALSPLEWIVAFGSSVSLPVVSLLLKHGGFRRTERILKKMSRQRISRDVCVNKVQRIANMVSAVARRSPYRAKILDQAITLWWLLGLMGIDSTVRFGIYKISGVAEPRAWVVYKNQVMIGNSPGESESLLDVNLNRG